MREFGVRRYGDSLYHHCMADSAADAANWFAHFQTGIEGKDFQALVKDVARPVSDEAGIGGETQEVIIRPRPPPPRGQAGVCLRSTKSLRLRPYRARAVRRRPLARRRRGFLRPDPPARASEVTGEYRVRIRA